MIDAGTGKRWSVGDDSTDQLPRGSTEEKIKHERLRELNLLLNPKRQPDSGAGGAPGADDPVHHGFHAECVLANGSYKYGDPGDVVALFPNGDVADLSISREGHTSAQNEQRTREAVEHRLAQYLGPARYIPLAQRTAIARAELDAEVARRDAASGRAHPKIITRRLGDFRRAEPGQVASEQGEVETAESLRSIEASLVARRLHLLRDDKRDAFRRTFDGAAFDQALAACDELKGHPGRRRGRANLVLIGASSVGAGRALRRMALAAKRLKLRGLGRTLWFELVFPGTPFTSDGIVGRLPGALGLAPDGEPDLAAVLSAAAPPAAHVLSCFRILEWTEIYAPPSRKGQAHRLDDVWERTAGRMIDPRPTTLCGRPVAFFLQSPVFVLPDAAAVHGPPLPAKHFDLRSIAGLQAALAQLRYDDVLPTGVYDDATRDAVISFQAARTRILERGIVGPKTRAALRTALDEQAEAR
ncbi:MAG: peptidoglycan-binding protein [Deltaproteobacteria bacterium]|nr:peptidoglycan-binding protein [Deltaproteobacteria bacterium]